MQEMRPEGRRKGLQAEVILMYKCVECGKEMDIDLQKTKKIICPYCGYRIIRKPRPPVIMKVESK